MNSATVAVSLPFLAKVRVTARNDQARNRKSPEKPGLEKFLRNFV